MPLEPSVLDKGALAVHPQSFEQRHRSGVLLVDSGDDAVEPQTGERIVQEARNGLGGVPLTLVLSREGEPDLGLPPLFLGL